MDRWDPFSCLGEGKAFVEVLHCERREVLEFFVGEGSAFRDAVPLLHAAATARCGRVLGIMNRVWRGMEWGLPAVPVRRGPADAGLEAFAHCLSEPATALPTGVVDCACVERHVPEVVPDVFVAHRLKRERDVVRA